MTPFCSLFLLVVVLLWTMMGQSEAHPCGPSDTLSCPQAYQAACAGDTRGDRRCNHDSTHRVCASIGAPDTSFFSFTRQRNWCNTVGYYGGEHGARPRCPPEHPTWCICKWAAARWMEVRIYVIMLMYVCRCAYICVYVRMNVLKLRARAAVSLWSSTALPRTSVRHRGGSFSATTTQGWIWSLLARAWSGNALLCGANVQSPMGMMSTHVVVVMTLENQGQSYKK